MKHNQQRLPGTCPPQGTLPSLQALHTVPCRAQGPTGLWSERGAGMSTEEPGRVGFKEATMAYQGLFLAFK